MSGEFSPEFRKWMTFTGSQAAQHGGYDPIWNERRAFRGLTDGTLIEATLCGEGGRRTTKTNMQGDTISFKYIGRIDLYNDKAQTELLFVDDGRVWSHTFPIDTTQPATREFISPELAAQILEEAIELQL